VLAAICDDPWPELLRLVARQGSVEHPVLSVGRFAGCRIDALPVRYLDRLLDAEWLPAADRRAVQAFLDHCPEWHALSVEAYGPDLC